jgi:hypothetical protein
LSLVVLVFVHELTPGKEAQIKEAQHKDPKLPAMKHQPEFSESSKGLLLFRGRVCIPEDEPLRQKVLGEGHNSQYSIHPVATKMYHDLRQSLWWSGKKNDSGFCC